MACLDTWLSLLNSISKSYRVIQITYIYFLHEVVRLAHHVLQVSPEVCQLVFELEASLVQLLQLVILGALNETGTFVACIGF
jgi:hypothetical protein